MQAIAFISDVFRKRSTMPIVINMSPYDVFILGNIILYSVFEFVCVKYDDVHIL